MSGMQAYTCRCGHTLTIHQDEVLDCCRRPEATKTALLPYLTGDELEELHLAIKERMNTLARERLGNVHAENHDLVAEIDRRGMTLQSLDTAVQEARSHLR